MGIPDGMTYLDMFGNFDILRAVQMGNGYQFQQAKAYPTTVNLKDYARRYASGGGLGDLLLDNLNLNAESPDVLFSLMRTGVSYSLGDFKESEVVELIQAKHDFFCSTRAQGDLTMPQYVTVQTSYRNRPVSLSPTTVTAVFNPGALAILSIPAYLVLDIASFATVGSATQVYGRLGIYENLAPPREPNGFAPERIDSLNDYMDAFHYGNFLWNNSDLWLTMYGLAYCITAFVDFVRSERLYEVRDSMNDLITFAPFNWMYDELVRCGAVNDPFDQSKRYWNICEDGIENAREVNESLYGALKLAELLQPVPIVTVPPGSVNAIFYGLIDIFPVKRYFGIESNVRFEFPKL